MCLFVFFSFFTNTCSQGLALSWLQDSSLWPLRLFDPWAEATRRAEWMMPQSRKLNEPHRTPTAAAWEADCYQVWPHPLWRQAIHDNDNLTAKPSPDSSPIRTLTTPWRLCTTCQATAQNDSCGPEAKAKGKQSGTWMPKDVDLRPRQKASRVVHGCLRLKVMVSVHGGLSDAAPAFLIHGPIWGSSTSLFLFIFFSFSTIADFDPSL